MAPKKYGSPSVRKSKQLVERSKHFKRKSRNSLIPRTLGRGRRTISPSNLSQSRPQETERMQTEHATFDQPYAPLEFPDFTMEVEGESDTIPDIDFDIGVSEGGGEQGTSSNDLDIEMDEQIGEDEFNPQEFDRLWDNLSSFDLTPETPPPPATPRSRELFEKNIQNVRDVYSQVGDRTGKQVAALESRGYQRGWDVGPHHKEQRWYNPSAQDIGHHAPLLPQSMKEYDIRPTDPLSQRREARRRQNRREWQGMEHRQVHQGSDYMIREHNLGRARDMMYQRLSRVFQGNPHAPRSHPSLRRVVPTLPQSLYTIHEDEEDLGQGSPYHSPQSTHYNTSEFGSYTDSDPDTEWED